MVCRAVEEAVERSAAPGLVAVALDRLADAHPGLNERLEHDPGLRDALVAIAAASRSLTDLCLTDEVALEVLANLDARPSLSTPRSTADLRGWKRRELLRIAARDLLGLDDLPAVGRALAVLAAEVLDGACALAGAQHLAVIGMGKLGGCELNYASDIDVMFVSGDAAAADDDERAARALLAEARACFRVDANLRPEGRDGPLTRSPDSYEAYWARWAQTWEFQALLKARPIAGNRDLGATFHARAQEALWSRPFTPDDLRAVRTMKARAEADLARRGLTDREVKRGRGGIRDIEFAVQLLQLVHGRHDSALRSPTTLDALTELTAAGYVEADDAAALSDAYRLLRTVEHRLQLEREQQVHAIPTDAGAQDRLARVMGYRDSPDASARDQLASELRRVQASVRSIHEHLFFRPLLDALSAHEGAPETAQAIMSDEAIIERLAAFGFTDARRTRAALAELTRGLTRSSRLMQQMLPLLLGWLSESPDPDLGLLGLRKLASGQQQAAELAVAFRDSPESARRLCLLLGTSRRLADTLERHPDLIPALGDPAGLAPRSEASMLDGATAAVAWRQGVDERQRGLQRFRRREELRIAAADVLGLLDAGAPTSDDGDQEKGAGGQEAVVITARQLTGLAESCISAALTSVGPPLPFAVIAMGRFGGAELSYASDLDVLIVYDGSTTEDYAAAEKTAEALLRFIGGPSPATQVYPLDLDLRPEGKDGPLARSLDGYRSYYERWAQTWERQALIRARFVAGDADVGRRFLELVEPYVWRHPLPENDIREIRRMKARIERERIPPGEDARFHLKLGRGSLSDVEWTAQLLQLSSGIQATGTMAALDALLEASALSDEDHAVLADAFRFCERTRNRWFLIKGAPDDSLPSHPEPLARLARSLDSTPTELREHYRRVTRRSRRVVERLFYGKEDE